MQKESAKKNIAKLPEECFGLLQIDSSLIVIRAGEMGYYRAPKGWLRLKHEGESIEDLCDRLNMDEYGATKAQRECMQMGSIFGWEAPAANLDNYYENGDPKFTVAELVERKYKHRDSFTPTENDTKALRDFLREGIAHPSKQDELFKDVTVLYPDLYAIENEG